MSKFLQKYVRYSSRLSPFLAKRSLLSSRSIGTGTFFKNNDKFQWTMWHFRRPFGVSRNWSTFRCYATKHGKKNFYNLLEVNPKASQATIKDAYYKLSMQHHPDRHKGSEKKHELFQEIAEAYSVLGNLELRKQYDRGLIVQGALAPEQARDAHAPRPTGSIYDFDEWTKQHYYEALKRKQRDKKERWEEKLEKETHQVQQGSLRLVIFLVFLAIVVIVSLTERHVLKERILKQEFKEANLD